VSAGVGILKDVLLKAARVTARESAAAALPETNSATPAPVSSLVRQLFFPAFSVQRNHVLFAAADAATNLSALCEQVGRALAEMSGATVAVMEATPSTDAASILKKRPGHTAGADWWRSCSSEITENVWRVPSSLISNQSSLAIPDGCPSAETSCLPFDYVLFASVVTDAETPMFCSMCDGAVLVLTANRTRREPAFRAREHLLRCNAKLLGTVLDGRTFPVPEPVYRRL